MIDYNRKIDEDPYFNKPVRVRLPNDSRDPNELAGEVKVYWIEPEAKERSEKE